MSYIMDLRKKVGHDPVIYLGTTLLVFNEKNEMLLNLRTDTLDWGIPGGGKELFETIEECAIRELKEETNIEANDLKLLAVLSGKEYYFEYPNGDETDCVIVLYKVENYNGELKINDDESKELKFFSLDDLPKLESRTKVIIDKIKNGEININ